MGVDRQKEFFLTDAVGWMLFSPGPRLSSRAGREKSIPTAVGAKNFLLTRRGPDVLNLGTIKGAENGLAKTFINQNGKP